MSDVYIRYKAGEPPPNYNTWAEEWFHFRSTNSKIEDTDPYKYKHNLIAPPKRTDPVTFSQKAYIRRLLRLPQYGPLPRCSHKLAGFVRRCEEKGDYSHSAKRHLCEACRCKRAAGWGTKGDFYGIGENTGHLGCGWCSDFERIVPRQTALAFAARQMYSLIWFGDYMQDPSKYREELDVYSKDASVRVQVRKEVGVVADVLRDLTQSLIPADTVKIVDALESLREAIDKSDFVTPEDAEQIKDLLESKALERTHLTEYQKGKLVKLSHKSEIELKLVAAKVLSGLKWNEFRMDANSYVHFDELAKRYPQHLRICRQALEQLRELLMKEDLDFDPIKKVYDWITIEHRRIWDNVKTGAKR